MNEAAQQHRQQHGTDDPQRHRPAMMEKEYKRRQDQGRAKDPISIADQTFSQHSQSVNKNGTDAKIANEHTQRQYQAHHAAHLPADRSGLRLAGGSPASRRTALFSCCFLL